MGVGKDWKSKNRVHTQFFAAFSGTPPYGGGTHPNPEFGGPMLIGPKPSSLPPVLSSLFFVILKEIIATVKGVCPRTPSLLDQGFIPTPKFLAWGFTFCSNYIIV
jgi:hypothetical protein